MVEVHAGRPMLLTSTCAALAAALLMVGLFALAETLWHWLPWIPPALFKGALRTSATGDAVFLRPSIASAVPIGVAILAGWMLWAALLYIFARRGDRYHRLSRLTVTLLVVGSIELVGGALMHSVVSRSWPPGVGPVGTGSHSRGAWLGGPVTTLMVAEFVLLWAMGLGVAMLFAQKDYLRRSNFPTCDVCGYDLRGTVSAGRTQCPECGYDGPKVARS